MIDRVYLDYVIDFIDFCAFDFWIWVFNIADACVCVGGGLLLLWCILSLIQESRADKMKGKVDTEQTEDQQEK